MPTLEKNDKIKLNGEKKSYRQPQLKAQLKEIGRVQEMTKGSGTSGGVDFSFPFIVDS